MKISLIWIASEDMGKNRKTLESVKTELTTFHGGLDILLYRAPKELIGLTSDLGTECKVKAVPGFEDGPAAAIYQDAAEKVSGTYVTQVDSGDTFSAGTIQEVTAQAARNLTPGIVMVTKKMPDGKVGAFSGFSTERETLFVNVKESFGCMPFYFGGTFVKKGLFKNYAFRPELGEEAERKFILDLCADRGRFLFVRLKEYHSSVEREGDILYFRGIYRPEHYDRAFTEFWLPYLDELKEKYGEIPLFIQYNLMFSITKRVQTNLNNRNKHVIEEGHEEEVLRLIGRTLQKLDDRAIFNAAKVRECIIGDSIKWIYGILKNGEDYRYGKSYLAGKTYYTAGNVAMNTFRSLNTNILFMNYEETKLEVDGTIHPLLYAHSDEIYFTFAGKKYYPEYNGRYALTKVFGVSIYQAHSFHLTIPLLLCKDETLTCHARIGDEVYRIPYTFQSHFSRMSNRFKNNYWWFGPEEAPFLMTKRDEGLRIVLAKPEQHKEQEKILQHEMLKRAINKKDRRALLFVAIRKAYFFMKPRMKKRPIWMYLDKIYKGGDSSEYLYRYASAQGGNIDHYYLIDKHATDYARLRRDGYKPLVRGTIKHRLVFLMADMMVISNSTVFAFNNFGMINSSYVRDLPDFHVCCVQHGMSVQKIAVAQNRLRDNTRLYFCASKYELHNLQKPIYDYMGYNALKLTGVPRYDGLINDDKKQIMISPTWRMQAAAPVRTSEGEQRDYNPLFKESSYFRVFNSLINDERLIAAAKKYGYRIKYVLHPIVSSQVKDFDTNEFVDIVPAVGDMSYETMFRESSLMVTDFSGIQFDFAYMRKPLVYLHHKEIPQHYEEGTFFYDTMAFGEIVHDNDELIELLTDYMANGCKMKDEYVRRADDFFFYRDHNNCERIYKEMIAYQDEHILGKKKYEKLQDEFDLKEYPAAAAEASAVLKANGMQPQPRTTNDDYFDLPVREGTVLVGGLGKNVRGNMQYILNELNSNPDFNGYRIYVRTDESTEAVVREYIRKNGWTRTEPVSRSSDYRRLLESVKYLITEVYFPESWVKKEGQVVINIWHGTPLKKLGLAKNSKNVHKDGNTQRNFLEADYLIYPNEYTRKNMLASYKVAELNTGRTGLIGYARTGGMLAACARDLTELKKRLAPNGEQLFAYMPTWKDYLKENVVVAETKELLDYLDTVLRDDQILYSNLHHKVSDVIDYDAYRHIRRFPADVDSYELLAATDALVTDYSSVFYDYLATRKQIVLYCADYELYRKKRGTYMDLMELPFDKAKTPEEVMAALNRGKQYDDQQAFEEFCGHDSVQNARKLTALLRGEFAAEEDRTVLTETPADSRKKLLIEAESFAPSETSEALKRFAASLDPEQYKIWLTCEMNETDANKKNAYPMMHDYPVIGTTQDVHMSGRGKSMRELYLAGKISFETAMAYLKYDYALHSVRMYGRAKFDAVVILEEQTAERLLSMAAVNAERSLLITAAMAEKMEAGDAEWIDAVRYAAGRCTHVWAENEDVKRVCEKQFGESFPMTLFAGEESLREVFA